MDLCESEASLIYIECQDGHSYIVRPCLEGKRKRGVRGREGGRKKTLREGEREHIDIHIHYNHLLHFQQNASLLSSTTKIVSVSSHLHHQKLYEKVKMEAN